jgi:hypothetical protein
MTTYTIEPLPGDPIDVVGRPQITHRVIGHWANGDTFVERMGTLAECEAGLREMTKVREIRAYRTMPLREGQETRVTEMLWGFGIGWQRYNMARYAADDDGPGTEDDNKMVAEIGAQFHSGFFEFSEDDMEIVIEYSGDETKVPELMAALRLVGFAAGRKPQ